MGRKKLWSSQQHQTWRALRENPAFTDLERIVSLGLGKIDLPELEGLIGASPNLPPEASLSKLKRSICDAAEGLPERRRSEALLAMLRATDEAANLPLDSAQRLARVKLGEADPHIPTLERKLHRVPTALELADALPRDNGHFRRAPKIDRKPGEYFLLLRELYRELVPAGRDTILTGADLDSVLHSAGNPRPGARRSMSKNATKISSAEANVEMVRKALKRQFRTDLDLTPLAHVLLTDQDVIEHLTIDVKLTDDGDEWFRFSVVREFHARFRDYTVAVVLGDGARAAVTRCIPELKDVIWLPPETENLDAVVEEMISDGLLEIRDRRSQSGFKAGRFTSLEEGHEFVTRLAEDDAITREFYRLLSLEIPAGGSDLGHFRSTLHMPLRKSRRRCAWFADGPTFVDRISVDLSGLVDAVESEHANVYFLLPGTSTYATRSELSGKRFERMVRDWAVRHHGFLIHW